MFEKEKENVIIVYPEKEAKYAHTMAQLISASSELEVVEWEDKDWQANKATRSSRQHVIFLGETGKDYKMAIKWFYDEYGIRYGWRGNDCVCEVKPLPVKDIKTFQAHYEARAKYLEVTSSQKMVDGKHLLIAGLLFAPLPWGISMEIIKYLMTKVVGGTTEFHNHQYQLLVYEFVLEGGFKKFVEDNPYPQ